MKTIRWKKVLFVATLLMVLLAQVFTLISNYGMRTLEIYKSIGQPARWRGANFAFSQEAADFYGFLAENIPQEALVLIPTQESGPEAFTRKGYVEFFLWPRIVKYCEGSAEECIDTVSNRNSAVLLTDSAALSNSSIGDERLERFSDQWGVFLPATSTEGNRQPVFRSIWEIALYSLPPLAFILALILPGTVLANRTLPLEHGLLHLALGIGLGFGWLSLSLFVALWLGAEFSALLIFSLVILYWLLAVILIASIKRNGNLNPPQKLDRSEWLTLLPIAVLVVWAFFLSIGNAYSHTDEIVLWGAKGYGIPAVGLQAGATERGTLTTWYPLNIPLLISSFLTLFSERLPESKFIFPFYFLGFLGLVYSFFRKKLQSGLSLVGVLLTATLPALFLMGTMAHANLPFTFYLVGGVLLFHTAQNRESTSSLHYWIWGIAILILAAWTRPEGIYLVWLAAITALVLYRGRLKRNEATWLFGVFFAYSLFWYFGGSFAYTKPGFTDRVFSQALSQVLHGNLHFWEAGYILRSLVSSTLTFVEWGAFGLLLVAFGILLAWRRYPKPSASDIAAFGVLIVLAIYAAFVANSYMVSEGRDVSWWVNTALLRLMFPGLILIWIPFFRESAEALFSISPKKA